MKKFLLAVAVTAGFASSAYAADLARAPVYKAPPPAPVRSWTGCYIGAGGGYGMYNIDHGQRDSVTGVGVAINQTSGGRGWMATGQVGCDYQFDQRWVVGIFGDFDATFYRGDYGTSIGATPLVGTLKQDWAWAAGARVGYLVTPSLMTFFSGGFTQAHFKSTDLTTLAGAATGISLDAQTFNGFFVGGGTEYAIDWIIPGLFWKSEARASYFEHKDVIPTCTGIGIACRVAGTTFGVTESRQPTVYSVRSELVYRFNWGGPVVARY